MQGLMQDWPLTVDKILDHARDVHGATEIVTRTLEGPVARYTYADMSARARRLTTALLDLGVRPGDRVGTLAWNTSVHMEAWYAIMGMGAVCHTLNPRLLPSQLAWMLGHAGDKVLLADACFAPLLSAILPGAPGVEHVVWLTSEAHRPAFNAPETVKGVHCLESLLDEAREPAPWGGFDEGTAAGLCYTSGTTGDPKGVLYSHRSNVLHALLTMQADIIGATALDTVLAIVPMFHANAWGLPFSAPAGGCRLVMPGPRLDGASIHELIETEQVTFSAAVPTVWANLLNHLRETGKRIDSLKGVIIGGAAVSQSMMAAFQDEYGVEVVHAWGMTETSPLGSVSRHTVRTSKLDAEGRMAVRMKQGRPPFGVELRVIGEDGREMPRDGHSFGRLEARGPAVAKAYFRSEDPILDADGFFDTGDIATLDPDGFMQITDRAKDVIKSGGEWISSLEIENHALAHPAVELAAVVGVPHAKWNERPVLLAKLRPGQEVAREGLLAWLEGKIAKWWMPDDVLIVNDIAIGATGKVDKKALRRSLEGYVLPSERPVAEMAAPAPVLYAPEPAPQAEADEQEASTPSDDDEPPHGPFPARADAPEPEALAADGPEPGPFPQALAEQVSDPPPPVETRDAVAAETVLEAVETPVSAVPEPAPQAPAPAEDIPVAKAVAAASPAPAWLEPALRGLWAVGLCALAVTVISGLLAPGFLDEAYKIEFAVAALALVGLVIALGVNWTRFGRPAVIGLCVALIGLGAALVLSSMWQPRAAFPQPASAP